MKVWLMAENMAATLPADHALVFSETARSHPGGDEAVRRADRLGRSAVRRRRDAHDPPEGSAERPEAGEPHVEADLGHTAIGLAQQVHRPLDPAPLQVAMRRLAERLLERAAEMRLAHQRDAGGARDVERPGVVAVHRVASAEQPAVLLFRGAAHGSIVASLTTKRPPWTAASSC